MGLSSTLPVRAPMNRNVVILISEPSLSKADSLLDPDIYDFISALIEQNAELAGRLDFVRAISSLPNRSITEASRHAIRMISQMTNQIREKSYSCITEAQTIAKTRADEIIVEANQKALSLISEAETTARARAVTIIAEANQKASSLSSEAQNEAQAKANTIVVQAKKAAESASREVIIAAIREGQGIIQAALEKSHLANTGIEAELEKTNDEVQENITSSTSQAKITGESKHQSALATVPHLLTPADRSASDRTQILARWLFQSSHTVVFTGAGISTGSGLPDFRGPNGIWTKRGGSLRHLGSVDWSRAKPNAAHMAIVELQNMNKLQFLISQNVDNLHLKSGIKPRLLAELHGNIFKVECRSCRFRCDGSPDLRECSRCGGELVSTVVDFGDPIGQKEWRNSIFHSKRCDLFIVAGSSLVVNPAARLPQIAARKGANLVIISEGRTCLDRICGLRFSEKVEEILPAAVDELRQLLDRAGS
jgi:NAD-dependent SIR2 family protein deacetylase/vacuolar-type H+-ATPase subunit H